MSLFSVKRDLNGGFCSSEERERIRHAVATVEETTSGEIAVMMVPESDSYEEAQVLGALFLSGIAAMAVAVATGHVTVWSYLPLLLLFFFPFLWLFTRFPRLKVPFVRHRRLEEAVRERAVRGFYEKGLYRTRDETGILIFISLLEHKVWIIGDRGINSRISQHTWSYLAGVLASGIREGRLCETLCAVIDECWVELAKYFPRRHDDINELPDEIM